MLHITGKFQFIGSDEHHIDTLEFRQRLYEGMHRTSELEVTAESDSEIIETADLPFDGKKISERLGRMGVRTVTCVNDRGARIER